MNDQSQADTSCCRDTIYKVMSARAAETHRSARPAAAASERLRFPGDHNEQVAVLRARGKFLARDAGSGALGARGGSSPPGLPTCPPVDGTKFNLLPFPGEIWVRLEQETSFKLIVLLLGCPFTLESSCWAYEEELLTIFIGMIFLYILFIGFLHLRWLHTIFA